jgi:hypothetical protein
MTIPFVVVMEIPASAGETARKTARPAASNFLAFKLALVEKERIFSNLSPQSGISA